jgi:hypothetical protein
MMDATLQELARHLLCSLSTLNKVVLAMGRSPVCSKIKINKNKVVFLINRIHCKAENTTTPAVASLEGEDQTKYKAKETTSTEIPQPR